MPFLSKFVSEDMKVSTRYKRGTEGAVQGEGEWGDVPMEGSGRRYLTYRALGSGSTAVCMQLQKRLSTATMGPPTPSGVKCLAYLEIHLFRCSSQVQRKVQAVGSDGPGLYPTSTTYKLCDCGQLT